MSRSIFPLFLMITLINRAEGVELCTGAIIVGTYLALGQLSLQCMWMAEEEDDRLIQEDRREMRRESRLTDAQRRDIHRDRKRRLDHEGSHLSKEDREERLIQRLDARRPQRVSRRIQRMWKGTENPQCSICYDHRDEDANRASDNWVEFPCSGKHKFHCKCIERWLIENTKCPYCRGGDCTDWDLFVTRRKRKDGDLIQLRSDK